MKDSPLINSIKPNIGHLIRAKTKVDNSITPRKIGYECSCEPFSDHIINKIEAISIPITNINDRSAWKFTLNGEY